MKGLTLVSVLALGILMFSGSVANAICLDIGFCDRFEIDLTPEGVSSVGFLHGVHDFSQCLGIDSVAAGNAHQGVAILTTDRAVEGLGTWIYEFDLSTRTWCNREIVGGILSPDIFCGPFSIAGSCAALAATGSESSVSSTE